MTGRAARTAIMATAALCGGCSDTNAPPPVPDFSTWTRDVGTPALDFTRPGRDTSAPPCTPSSGVAEDYGEVAGLKAANEPWNAAEQQWEVSAYLEGTSGPRWELRLHPGRGQLPIRLAAPAVYEIGGADARIEDCAVCSYLVVEQAGAEQIFMADYGLLEIEAIERGGTIDVIKGSLQDASFKAIELTPSGADCTRDDQCGNTRCAASGRCMVQTLTGACGTIIGRIAFMTP